MAVKLPKSLFVHIPRTGGMWVRAALHAAKVPIWEVGTRHTWIDQLRENPRCMDSPVAPLYLEKVLCRSKGAKLPATRGSFAFVRNPVTWYQSWWAFMMQERWSKGTVRPYTHEKLVYSQDFNEFVDKSLYHFPGYLSATYDLFLDGVSLVYKLEDLPYSLIQALDRFKEKYDRKKILATPPENTSSKFKEHAVYDPAAIRRFQY
jgi:hypothetical protein